MEAPLACVTLPVVLRVKLLVPTLTAPVNSMPLLLAPALRKLT